MTFFFNLTLIQLKQATCRLFQTALS